MRLDNPELTAVPEYDAYVRDFNDLSLRDKLDIVQDAIRKPVYKLALIESLPESNEYASWLNQLVDSTVSDADVGRAAREIVCAYIAEVAGYRAENIL